MELSIIVYTMKGCPFCVDFKKMLDESNIEYFDRDIDENSEEYDEWNEKVREAMWELQSNCIEEAKQELSK